MFNNSLTHRSISIVGNANFNLFFTIRLAILLFYKSSTLRLLLVFNVPTIWSMHFSVILLFDKLTCSRDDSHNALAIVYKPSSESLFFDRFKCLKWPELNLIHFANSIECISLKLLFDRSSSPLTADVLKRVAKSYFFLRPKLLFVWRVADFFNLHYISELLQIKSSLSFSYLTSSISFANFLLISVAVWLIGERGSLNWILDILIGFADPSLDLF